jgi:type III secretion system low calcium response chaperone LcrH/SycD
MPEKNIFSPDETEKIISVEDLINNIQEGCSIAAAMGISKEKLEAVYATGYQFFNQGKYEKAMKLFGFLLIHEQSDRRFFIAFGTCLQMLSAPAEAIKYLSIASVWEPSDPGPAVQISECLLSMGRSNEAYKLLKEIDNEFGSLSKFEGISIKVKSMLKIKALSDIKKQIICD